MLISASELVKLNIHSLPSSRQGIEYHAKKNSWAFEEVAGQARGGKLKKYLVSALPAEIQTAICQWSLKSAPLWAPKSAPL